MTRPDTNIRKEKVKSCWNVREFEKAQEKVSKAGIAFDAIVRKRCPVGIDIEWWHGNHIQQGEVVSSGGARAVQVKNHKTGTVKWVPTYFITKVGGKS